MSDVVYIADAYCEEQLLTSDIFFNAAFVAELRRIIFAPPAWQSEFPRIWFPSSAMWPFPMAFTDLMKAAIISIPCKGKQCRHDIGKRFSHQNNERIQVIGDEPRKRKEANTPMSGLKY